MWDLSLGTEGGTLRWDPNVRLKWSSKARQTGIIYEKNFLNLTSGNGEILNFNEKKEKELERPCVNINRL